MDVSSQICALFAQRGQQTYGEAVSQIDHAVQTAALAVRDGCSDALIVAALLHDIGHLVAPAPDQPGTRDHAGWGADFLLNWFDEAISEPVRLHVEAKRYLCATDPDYFDHLSAASKASLAVQGGPYSAAECRAFEVRPGAADALTLRRYDDDGKIEGLTIAPFDHYGPQIRAMQCKPGPDWTVAVGPRSCA